MALQDVLAMCMPTTSISWTLLPFVLGSWIALRCIYRIFFHPLRQIPGPLYTKCSSLWLLYHQYIGDPCTAIHTLHNVYGPVVRVTPNDIDIAKIDALGPIYVDQGGFDKSEYYRKYDILGHATIFSTLSLPKRVSRAKAVLPVFSTSSVTEATETISACANKLARRIGEEAKAGNRVNILNLGRAFALDAFSAYAFHQSYGALEEDATLPSVTPYLYFISRLGGHFFVSHSLFVAVQWLLHFIPSDHKTESSFKTMGVFLDSLVDQAKAGSSSYPSRLLAKGLRADEVAKECGDVAYAGTDSTGHILATICWNLAAYPEK